MKQKKTKTGNAAGIITFGIAFFLTFGLFSWGILWSALFSLGAAWFVRWMAQGLDTTTHNQRPNEYAIHKETAETQEAPMEIDVTEPESLEKVKADTGNAEVDALLAQGREMIREIRSENDLIPDSSLSDKLDQLEDKCASIFQAVYEKPSKAGQIRKFMNYYLPTTLKMVKAYRTLGDKGVSPAQVEETRWRIDCALQVVLDGCQKTLDSLYREDVLDITTDIDVLEQMLKRDGLTETDLEKAAQQAREAARLDNAVNRVPKTKAQEQPAVPTLEEYRTRYARTDTGVSQQVANAQEKAQNHVSEAPTLYGGVYRAGGAAAQAQAPDKN